MRSDELQVILKRFDAPDEVREFEKGRFEVVRLGGVTIGRATYQPGWRWSEHVGPSVGASYCHVEHVGLVLSGTATAAFQDGTVVELHAGNYSTFRLGRMIVGWLASSRMFRFIFSAPR